MSEGKISRRQFLGVGVTSTVAALSVAGCNVLRRTFESPPPTPSIANGTIITGLNGEQYVLQDGMAYPIGTVAAPATITPTELPQNPTPTAEAMRDNKKDIVSTLQGLNIKVDENLPLAVPRSYAEAAASVSADKNNPINADRFVPVIEHDEQGEQIWRGWWMAEPPFPFKQGIGFDSQNGYHIDAKGNPIFDPTHIFETNWEKLPSDVKDNFASLLVDLKIQKTGVALFARRGGITRNGLPKNTHNFTGTNGSEVDAIEQLTIIPVPEDICPEDVEKSAVTRAYRQAVMEFRDNKDAREGKLTVKWFDPEQQKWIVIKGGTVARLALEKHDLSILDRLSAGEPISPDNMVEKVGGKPEQWLWNPTSGEWFYEAFPLLPDTKYVSGVGHVRNKRLLVGVKHADINTTEIFDFKNGPVNMASSMKASGQFPAVLFMRAGQAVQDNRFKNHSWYTFGNGEVLLGTPGIEQATWMPLNPNQCPTGDEDQQLMARAQTLAQDQPDKKVTALYWDGSQFNQVNK